MRARSTNGAGAVDDRSGPGRDVARRGKARARRLPARATRRTPAGSSSTTTAALIADFTN
jgi:hypothetical protein